MKNKIINLKNLKNFKLYRTKNKITALKDWNK